MRLLVLACLLAAAAPARADGFYFFENFGGSDVKSELGEHMSSAFSVKIGVGMRSGAWAVEPYFGAHVNVPGAPYEEGALDGLGIAGVDLKYIQPLSKHVEVYLRGGLAYGWIDQGRGTPLHGYAGRGMLGGAGIQLKGKVRVLGFLAWPLFFLKIGPKVTASVWLDSSYSFYRLHPGGELDATPAIDSKFTTLSGGFAIGSDF